METSIRIFSPCLIIPPALVILSGSTSPKLPGQPMLSAHSSRQSPLPSLRLAWLGRSRPIEITRTEGLKSGIYVALVMLEQCPIRRQVVDALLSLRCFFSDCIVPKHACLAYLGFNCSQTLHFTIRLSALKLSKMYKVARHAVNTPFSLQYPRAINIHRNSHRLLYYPTY